MSFPTHKSVVPIVSPVTHALSPNVASKKRLTATPALVPRGRSAGRSRPVCARIRRSGRAPAPCRARRRSEHTTSTWAASHREPTASGPNTRVSTACTRSTRFWAVEGAGRKLKGPRFSSKPTLATISYAVKRISKSSRRAENARDRSCRGGTCRGHPGRLRSASDGRRCPSGCPRRGR